MKNYPSGVGVKINTYIYIYLYVSLDISWSKGRTLVKRKVKVRLFDAANIVLRQEMINLTWSGA